MWAHPVETVIDRQWEAARLVNEVRAPAGHRKYLMQQPGVADLHTLRTTKMLSAQLACLYSDSRPEWRILPMHFRVQLYLT